MNEIIDTIISLLYVLKYDSLINKRRNFKKKINLYKEIAGSDADVYRLYVINEIARLKIKPHSEGIPVYAIFEKNGDTTRVFILNDQLQFMYRLENYNTCVTSSFYFKLSS